MNAEVRDKTTARLRSQNYVIGRNIKTIREWRGFSQKALGECMDRGDDQIGRYETGENRVSAAALEVFAEFLKVPVFFFFVASLGDLADLFEAVEDLPKLVRADVQVGVVLKEVLFHNTL